MYYSHTCLYCTKVFYTYHNSKDQASHILYRGIKAHLIEYNEDHKEYKFDDGEQADSDEIYYEIIELSEPPADGYKLQ